MVIDAPVESVFAFHEREDALARLSPSFPRVRVVRKTGGIAVGSESSCSSDRFRGLRGTPRTRRTACSSNEQIQGPFRRWIHRHEFEGIGGRTRLTDRVEYRLRGGPDRGSSGRVDRQTRITPDVSRAARGHQEIL